MSIYKGGYPVSGVVCGDKNIAAVYKGDILLYQNKPQKWLHITPIGINSWSCNLTTEYGDCRGMKQANSSGLHAMYTGYEDCANSDKAWYQAIVTVSSSVRDPIVSFVASRADAYGGPGIYMDQAMSAHGICVTRALMNSNTQNRSCKVAVFVIYEDGTTEVKISNNATRMGVVFKYVFDFGEERKVKDIIIAQKDSSHSLMHTCYCGIYLLRKDGTLNLDDIPGEEII